MAANTLLQQGRPGVLPGLSVSRQMVSLLELGDSGHRLGTALAIHDQISATVDVQQVLQRLYMRTDSQPSPGSR